MVYYNVKRLFGESLDAPMGSDIWKTVLHLILDAWNLADAAAIHPQEMNEMAGGSVGVLMRLRDWTHIRKTGKHFPDENYPDEDYTADDATRKWAAAPFDWEAEAKAAKNSKGRKKRR